MKKQKILIIKLFFNEVKRMVRAEWIRCPVLDN